MTSPSTIARLENAITITAEAMTLHPDLGHQLLPTLKGLEVECDKLATEGDPIEYAKRLLTARAWLEKRTT
jgi:hypothetical protein